MVYPLVLGSGERFFRDGGGRTTLALSDAKTTTRRAGPRCTLGRSIGKPRCRRSFCPSTGGRDDRQAHAVALGRHTLVCSSPVAGRAGCVRHPAERAAPRAGAGVPRAGSLV